MRRLSDARAHDRDPDGIEGPAGAVDGLGLLDVDTELSADKTPRTGGGTTADGAPFAGYEMHMGAPMGRIARGHSRISPTVAGGAISADGRIAGTYVHGLFADDRQRAAWLTRLGAGPCDVAYEEQVERTLDALAAHLAAHHRSRPAAQLAR